MHDFLDIYTKLIIAIISFIAPVIVYLLSVFSDGIAIITRRAKEEENQIGKLLRERMADMAANIDTQLIDSSNKALKDNAKKNKRRLCLLDPERQIYRIFCSLFLALILIMIDILIRDKRFISLYSHTISVSLILGSFVCFIIGLLILRQVAEAIIDTKKIIAQDKSAVTIGTN